MLAPNPESWRKLVGENSWPRIALARLLRAFGELAPKGLYARALIIIIAPIVLLESVVAFTFMERHWSQVTRRLSEGMARDMAALVDMYESSTGKDDIAQLIDIGQNRFGLSVAVLPSGNLPTPQPKPFFDLLDRALSDEIRAQVKRPFWIDTVGQSRHVEIRVKLDQAILRFVAPRGQAYASNSHIFLIWMVGTSVVLLTVAILFLRNQIRPVLRLAEAADAFGKGRPVPPDFRPRGAREVRQAAQAFLEMRERIRHHVEQRTTMLAGVSHDLRTVLTRFKRAVTNLVTNAARFGNIVIIRAAADETWLRIEVDDDGPGVPPAERDNVFRPFYRLDHARNQDAGNSGLGLAIARDIARSHGGDIALGVSSMGGLRATMRVPL